MDKNSMTREEKEAYLMKMLIDEGLLKERYRFKERLSKVSDSVLDLKIESMEMYLDKE